eukprot:m.90417 g.90417  ORF g.90417 m.90417 type:complete len:713 (-) comp13266_c0_seq2:70-2208(-)
MAMLQRLAPFMAILAFCLGAEVAQDSDGNMHLSVMQGQDVTVDIVDSSGSVQSTVSLVSLLDQADKLCETRVDALRQQLQTQLEGNLSAIMAEIGKFQGMLDMKKDKDDTMKEFSKEEWNDYESFVSTSINATKMSVDKVTECGNKQRFLNQTSDQCVPPFDIDCGSPIEGVRSVKTSCTDTKLGSECIIECIDADVTAKRKCALTGQWEGEPIVCPVTATWTGKYDLGEDDMDNIGCASMTSATISFFLTQRNAILESAIPSNCLRGGDEVILHEESVGLISVAYVDSVSASGLEVQFSQALPNVLFSARSAVIVMTRMPSFDKLTITSSAVLTAPKFNISTTHGGIVAIRAKEMIVDGTIDATRAGYAGGSVGVSASYAGTAAAYIKGGGGGGGASGHGCNNAGSNNAGNVNAKGQPGDNSGFPSYTTGVGGHGGDGVGGGGGGGAGYGYDNGDGGNAVGGGGKGGEKKSNIGYAGDDGSIGGGGGGAGTRDSAGGGGGAYSGRIRSYVSQTTPNVRLFFGAGGQVGGGGGGGGGAGDFQCAVGGSGGTMLGVGGKKGEDVCDNSAENGANGGSGENGGGIILLIAEKLTFGSSAKLLADGGRGGNGGDGGQGSNATKCGPVGAGGAGGGGSGGQGAGGGAVLIIGDSSKVQYPSGKTLDDIASVQAGEGGDGGDGGLAKNSNGGDGGKGAKGNSGRIGLKRVIPKLPGL